MPVANLPPEPIEVFGTVRFVKEQWPFLTANKAEFRRIGYSNGTPKFVDVVISRWEKGGIFYEATNVSINKLGVLSLTVIAMGVTLRKTQVSNAELEELLSKALEVGRTPESANHVNLTVDITPIVRNKTVQVYPDYVRFIGESGPETVYFRDMGYGAAAAARKAFLEGNSGYRATMISYTVKDLGLKKLCLPDPTIEP